MTRSQPLRPRPWTLHLALALLVTAPRAARAADPSPPADESVLGELPITGTATEHVTKLAVLPSLAPDLEDVVVRGIVRRDLELTSLFSILDDAKAPEGLYGYSDPVDVAAWQKVGAEVIVKVSARKHASGKIEVSGLAYFLDVGKDPVYEKVLLVDAAEVRVTAHRITDALLGALTGRNGGFASRLTYAGPWGRDYRIFTVEADGHELKPVTPEDQSSIAPVWGPDDALYYPASRNYAPYRLMRRPRGLLEAEAKRVELSVPGSVYGVSFDREGKRMAVALSEGLGSAIYVGGSDGRGLKKVSTTELATHPVFSPSGKLAWIGGGARQGTQRVYVEGKPVSPGGFTASAPTFCDTENGIRLVYSVAVGGDHRDLVMSTESGGGVTRLTQHQGSNTYPACSPDGRLLAFFSTRNKQRGIYVMSLVRFLTLKFSSQYGESLRWTPLPPAPSSARADAPARANAPPRPAPEPRPSP